MAKTKIAKVAAPTEAQEQIALFEWIDLVAIEIPQLRMAFHPANGEMRNKVTAARLKRMGVRPGVPDVWLPARSGAYSGLVIELKRSDKSNKASEKQKEWLKLLEGQGWQTAICFGWVRAAQAILEYFEVPRTEWMRLGVELYINPTR